MVGVRYRDGLYANSPMINFIFSVKWEVRPSFANEDGG